MNERWSFRQVEPTGGELIVLDDSRPVAKVRWSVWFFGVLVDLVRPLGEGDLAESGWYLVLNSAGQLEVRLEGLGGGHVGHLDLMLEPGLHHLKGRREVEDRAAFLDHHHPTGGERAALPDPIDVVDDRELRVSGAEEVGVEAVHRAVVGDGLRRRGEGPAEDQPPEHSTPPEILALPPEQVHLDALERQQLDPLRQDRHGGDGTRDRAAPKAPAGRGDGDTPELRRG